MRAPVPFYFRLVNNTNIYCQGGDGTELTHWEKRVFQNEAMTGTVHTNDPLYSRLTFALMEDTGWYLPDYSQAEPMTWGLNAGCDFAKKSCKELMEEQGSCLITRRMTVAFTAHAHETLSCYCSTVMGLKIDFRLSRNVSSESFMQMSFVFYVVLFSDKRKERPLLLLPHVQF